MVPFSSAFEGDNSQQAALLNPNYSGLTATRMTVSRNRQAVLTV